MLSVVEMMSSESTEVFDPSCRIPLPYVKVRYADLTQGVEIALGLPEDVERYVVSHQSDDLRRVFFKVSDDDATHPWLDVYLSVPGGYTSLPEAILSVRPKPSWCARRFFINCWTDVFVGVRDAVAVLLPLRCAGMLLRNLRC